MYPSTACDPPGAATTTHRLESGSGMERRKYRRASLTWTVYLKCDSVDSAMLTKTRDISRDGFYCLLNLPVRPGERVECDIIVPTHDSPDQNDVVYLRCRARAVRVEEIETERFGMACRIEEYRLVRQASPHEPAPGRAVVQNIGLD